LRRTLIKEQQVNVESVVGARYFERPEHVIDFKQAFERVWTQAAALEEHIK
jgi:hypothetical protein